MSKKNPQPTNLPRERAFLVGVDLYKQKSFLPLEDSLSELALLSDTSGLDVVGELTQKLDRPHVKTYIGPGKVDELKALVEETTSQVVIFDDELLPRLTGQWTHLERQAGGGGGRAGSTGGVGLRGPGETQLEVDKRAIRKRIAHLKKELEKVREHRMRYRAQRKRSRIPTVALVGYTNAGKSTLLNKITKSDVYVADQLFATLDPTTRRVELPGGYQALFTDTVGFIQKLPTALVEAFHATLEEIVESDLLLHVVDISHPNALNQFESVQQTLNELGAKHIPIVTALNKVDQLRDPESAKNVVSNFSKAVTISALDGNGVKDLLALLQEELYETYAPILVRLPYQQGALISLFHEAGQIERIEHGRGGVLMQGRIPGRLLAQFSDWQVASANHHEPADEEDEL